jgi:threonine synthase
MALTLQIQGDFDEAMKMVKEITEESDVYLLNLINPFVLEAKDDHHRAIGLKRMEGP